jgi:hypothetical protein
MSIISGSWGIMVFRLDIEIYVLGKCGTKRGAGKGEDGEKMYRDCWVLQPLCMFGYISVVVVESSCVRNCRGIKLCRVGTVG